MVRLVATKLGALGADVLPSVPSRSGGSGQVSSPSSALEMRILVQPRAQSASPPSSVASSSSSTQQAMALSAPGVVHRKRADLWIPRNRLATCSQMGGGSAQRRIDGAAAMCSPRRAR